MRRYHDSSIEDTLCQDQFARRIAPQLNVTIEEATHILHTIRHEMKKCILEEGLNIKIKDIGTIGTKIREERTLPGNDFLNGYTLPKRRSLFFRPSSILNKELRERGLTDEEQNS